MRGVSILHPARLVLLALLPLLYAAWRRWPPALPRARSRLALGMRLALVTLLVLAVAGLRVMSSPRHRAVVAVVDLSDSTTGAGDAQVRAVRAMAEATRAGDLFGVVTFGRDALVELPPTASPVFEEFQTRPDGSYTDLARALRLAANLAPEGYGRQLVLLSDGRQNLGDAAATVADLRVQAVRVDILPVGAPWRDDVAVLALDAPASVRAGQTVTATVRLRSSTPASGSLALQVDGREVARRRVELAAGISGQAFDLPALDPGVHRLRTVVDAQPDGFAQNDVSEAVVRVLERPAVLLVEAVAGAADNVAAALGAGGMRTEVRKADDVPTEAAGLAGYDSVVLVDVPAEAIARDAQAAIATSVAQLGRGFVAVGGTASYGPGGWKDTPLEEALPVRMDIPTSRQKPAVAAAIVMETTEDPAGDTVALGAAESVIDQLGPDDEVVVVVMHQSGSFYAVPLTRVTDRDDIKRRIQAVGLGDPPGYGASLQLGFDALAASTAATKHLVIIGDGDATADIGQYPSLFSGAPAVIVSAVGVDVDKNPAFMGHMAQLARLGGGRYYHADDQSRIPRILLQISRDALRPWYENDPFSPRLTSAGDLLAGVGLDAFPQLGGYVVTTPKAAGEVALTSPKGDPVLAGWQYGLGRAVAWTSDARGRWTAGLLASPVGGSLFARMVAWTVPAPSTEGLSVETVPAGDGLDVSVDGPQESAEVAVEVAGPGAASSSVSLRATGPGHWEARVPTAALGTYVLHASVRRAGEVVAQSEIAVAVPYSPEYLEAGRDDGFLAQLARVGGTLLSRPEAVWAQRLRPSRVAHDAFWLLLLGAVVIWPVDVAVRRVTLSPRQVWSELRAGLVNRRRIEEKG